jgi:iron complex outermembrane receptor protein
MRFQQSVLAASLWSCVLSIAPGALRAQSGTAVTAELDEVVVTARRREESLQDVPIAVTAYSATDLEKTGAADITALQQSTPNLTLQVARGSNSTLIAFIRGVGQQDPLWGFEPGVGLYVDDVYIARPQGAVLDVYDIQRIEVLRGPQGTLYGRNTIGGAVKYVTAPLGRELKAGVRASVGSFGQRDAVLSATLPLGADFSVGGAVAVFTRNGFGTNLYTNTEHYNKDETAARLSAEWHPADATLVRVSGDYFKDRSNARHGHREAPGLGLSAGEVVLPNVYDTRGGVGNNNHVRTRGVAAMVQHDLNDVLTLKSITAWRDGRTDTLIDFDMGPAAALDIPAYYADRQFSEELQLLWNGERLKGVGGLYYFRGNAEGAFDTVIGIANLTTATSGFVKTRSYAAFTDLSYRFNERWSASVGGRYTQDEKTGQVYRQNFTGLRSPLFGGAAAVPGLLRTNPAAYAGKKLSFSEFTPRVSVSLEPSDATTWYASYGRGFKSGGFDMRGDAVFYPQTVDGYKPEFVDTYELGAKALLAAGRLRLAAAVFQSDYQDQQVTTQFLLGTTVISFVDNVASSDIKGAELEAEFKFNTSLSAALRTGYIDAAFNEFVTYDATTGTRRDVAALRGFQNTPKNTAALSVTYSQPAGRGTLAFTPSVSHRSSYQLFEIPIPLLDQSGYTLYDASLVWSSNDGRLTAGLHGKNLGDERYRVGGYNFPGAVTGNSVNGFYGPPRTVTLTFTYRMQ